jgi:hypothetical protein
MVLRAKKKNTTTCSIAGRAEDEGEITTHHIHKVALMVMRAKMTTHHHRNL